jgi:endonuclease YncB( thermonuclease family)
MSSSDRINPYRVQRTSFGRRFAPWVFIVGVAIGAMLPLRQWLHWPQTDSRLPETELILKHAGSAEMRHPVDVLWTIDGDTFESRLHLSDGLDVATRVRLRGIDAAELKASCPQELQLAQAATVALRSLLGQGDVVIYNIGPDKYQGRVVADVATKTTANVSAAMLASGHARAYNGGHRGGWCANASR